MLSYDLNYEYPTSPSQGIFQGIAKNPAFQIPSPVGLMAWSRKSRMELALNVYGDWIMPCEKSCIGSEIMPRFCASGTWRTLPGPACRRAEIALFDHHSSHLVRCLLIRALQRTALDGDTDQFRIAGGKPGLADPDIVFQTGAHRVAMAFQYPVDHVGLGATDACCRPDRLGQHILTACA